MLTSGKEKLKAWKNKELNENLSEKWGFSMNLNLLKEQEEEQEKDEEEQEKDEKSDKEDQPSDVMEEDMQASYDELQRLRALPNPTPQEQDTMDIGYFQSVHRCCRLRWHCHILCN